MIIEQTYCFSADHPALAGHFPDNPIVPGACLLTQAAELALERGSWRMTGIRRARFKTSLRPGVDYVLRLAPRDDGGLDLTCEAGSQVILTAVLDIDSGQAAQ